MFLPLTTGSPRKKFTVTPGSILSQSQAFSTESNQSQSSIHVNIMVPGVTVNFLLGLPVYITFRENLPREDDVGTLYFPIVLCRGDQVNGYFQHTMAEIRQTKENTWNENLSNILDVLFSFIY